MGQAQHLNIVERLGESAIDRIAEIFAHGFDIANDQAVVFAGAASIKLRLVAIDGFDFLLPECRHIHDKGSGEIYPQMSTKVVDDAFAVVRLSRDRGFGQFAVKAGVFTDSRDGDVIRVGVVRIGEKENIGTELSIKASDAMAGLD